MAYFEPFMKLPGRHLKDYYEVITEPLSLRALLKQVRGQLGRGEATYVSVFKTWVAFEDQCSLIWKNAYHYNEDGSEIFVMAQELEVSGSAGHFVDENVCTHKNTQELFHELLKEAKVNVAEPPQPKIKLKVPTATETPTHPKKITIHVGGKSSAAASPAPVTGQSSEGEAVRNGTPMNRNPFSGTNSVGASVSLSQLEKARSMSTSAGPPSPSTMGVAKPEEAVQSAPVMRPQATPTTFQQFVPVGVPHASVVPNGNGVYHQTSALTPSLPPPPPPAPKKSAADILEATKYRSRPIRKCSYNGLKKITILILITGSSEALMPKLTIMCHPQIQVEAPMLVTIPASLTEYQQEIMMSANSSNFRLQLKPQISAFLEEQQREWKLNVMHDGIRLYPSHASYEVRGEPVFDVQLKYGNNRFDVSVVAALPRGETNSNGLSMEMERFVVLLNLLRY